MKAPNRQSSTKAPRQTRKIKPGSEEFSDQMELLQMYNDGAYFDSYILSSYKRDLERLLKRHPQMISSSDTSDNEKKLFQTKLEQITKEMINIIFKENSTLIGLLELIKSTSKFEELPNYINSILEFLKQFTNSYDECSTLRVANKRFTKKEIWKKQLESMGWKELKKEAEEYLEKVEKTEKHLKKVEKDLKEKKIKQIKKQLNKLRELYKLYSSFYKKKKNEIENLKKYYEKIGIKV
jgi:chromosome segregation ATPase